MILTAITTCTTAYTDYLHESLALSDLYESCHRGQPLSRRLIVVDSLTQIATHPLCEFVMAPTEARGPRSIGESINVALGIAGEGWICRLDADTVLPPNLLELLPARLYRDALYSMPLRWCDYRNYELLLHHIKCAADPDMTDEDRPRYRELDCSRGIDITHQGYFQMWYNDGSITYPTQIEPGEDTAFAEKWPKEKRLIIPNCYALHLGQPGMHRNGVIPFCEFGR